LKGNPDLSRAEAKVDQSRSGVRAGKADFLPEVSAFARQTHQDGAPFLRSNYSSFGLTLSWSIFDGGRKAYVVSQRNALLSQASEDRDRLRRRVEIDLGKVLRRIETSKLLEEAASESLDMHLEKARLAANQSKAGVISAAKAAEAEAAARASEADFLAARLGLELDYAELNRLLGRP